LLRGQRQKDKRSERAAERKEAKARKGSRREERRGAMESGVPLSPLLVCPGARES